MKRARGLSRLLAACAAVGLLAGSAVARVPYPVDSTFADSVRIAVLSNNAATTLCSTRVNVGLETRDFVIGALDTAYCRNVRTADAATATMDAILAMFDGKMPHVIVHINAGWGSNAPAFPSIMTWAAQYNVGLVEVGDDDAAYLTRVFTPWAAYAPNYAAAWLPMMTGVWLADTLDSLYIRLQPGMDVAADSAAYPNFTGLLRNTVKIEPESTLYFSPFGPTGRCESDPDIYTLDSVTNSHMLNLAYQQGYNAVCDTDTTLTLRARDLTCSTTVRMTDGSEYYCLRVLQDSIPIGLPDSTGIGATSGVRRAVALSFEPQYLADSVAAAQIVYDAVMYSSMVHLVNPPAPEVGVRQKLTNRDLPAATSLFGMRGAKIRVTDMAGRAVYAGIIGSGAQLRKAIGALPVGVYLMTATKDGLVRSSAYAVAR